MAAGQLRAFANGTEEVPVYSWNTPSNSSTGMYIPETRSIGFTTNGRERFRIPNEAQVYAMQNGDSHLPFYSWASNTNMGMYRAGINVLGFSTAGTERMRIGSNGDFGIGTDDPLTRFHVSMNRINAPALASHITVSNSGYGAGEFWNPNTLDGTGLHGTGFIGVYGQSTSIEGWAGYFREDLGVEGGVFSGEGYFLLSDRRIKRNFRAIENGLDLVMKLKPQKYQKLIQIETGVKSIFEKSERHSNKIKPSDEFGLIAQEVEVILPELIATKKMNVKGLGVVDLKSVNYSGFVPILIKAIQQQQAQIIILEGRLNALEMASKG